MEACYFQATSGENPLSMTLNLVAIGHGYQERKERLKEGRVRGVQPNGCRLADARRSLGLTQEQLALQADVDEKTVRNAEASKRLDLATLARLAAAVQVALPELLPVASPQPDDRLQVVQLWQAAWNQRSIMNLLACYHHAAVLRISGDRLIPFAGTHRGHEGISNALALVFDCIACQACRSKDTSIHTSPEAVTLRTLFKITGHNRHSTRLSSVHILIFEASRIREHHVEYDTLALCQALQLTPRV